MLNAKKVMKKINEAVKVKKLVEAFSADVYVYMEKVVIEATGNTKELQDAIMKEHPNGIKARSLVDKGPMSIITYRTNGKFNSDSLARYVTDWIKDRGGKAYRYDSF